MKKYVVLLVLLVLLTGCDKKIKPSNYETKIQKNINKEVISDTSINHFDFTNISLIWNGNKTTYQATVTNTTDHDIKIKDIKIILKADDKDIVLTCFLGTDIKAHQSKMLVSNYYNNIVGAKGIEYSVIEDN